jgi:hypothetical protein
MGMAYGPEVVDWWALGVRFYESVYGKHLIRILHVSFATLPLVVWHFRF